MEIITMPVMPISFYSNYYIFEWIFNGNTTGFLASKVTRKAINNAATELLVQGKPGFVVQNVPTAYYEYTIEAPLLITNQNNASYLSPYNSLLPLAAYLTNTQWTAMNADSSTPLNSVDVVMQSFTIDFQDQGVNQTIVLLSNVDLVEAGYFNYWLASSNPHFNTITGLISRVVRNYDLFTNMFYNDVFNNQYTLFTENAIFMDSYHFEIKFEIDKKYFMNQSYNNPLVTFVLKNYSFDQNYGIVGFTDNTLFTDNFDAGFSIQRNTTNILQISGNYPTILVSFQAPVIVKTTSQTFAQDQLLRTQFDFSFYGVIFSPTNSPYGFGNLLAML